MEKATSLTQRPEAPIQEKTSSVCYRPKADEKRDIPFKKNGPIIKTDCVRPCLPAQEKKLFCRASWQYLLKSEIILNLEVIIL